MEIVSDGSPLPPVGFVADVGHVAFGSLRSSDLTRLPSIEGLEHTITRRYEDYVLGKLFADISFERAGDALLRYSGRDRNRGLAYIVNQQRLRCGFGGAVLSPAVIKALKQIPGDELCEQAWQCLDDEGLSVNLLADYESLIAAIRNVGELLGAEDVFELESGTALAEFGQRIALRQVVLMATKLRNGFSEAETPFTATPILRRDQHHGGGPLSDRRIQFALESGDN